MRYLLDTNIMIAAMKGVAPVKLRLEHTLLADILLSPIVLGELEFGVEKSAHREKNVARLAALAQKLELAPIDARVSRCYAEIRAHLERFGTPPGRAVEAVPDSAATLNRPSQNPAAHADSGL